MFPRLQNISHITNPTKYFPGEHKPTRYTISHENIQKENDKYEKTRKQSGQLIRCQFLVQRF